MSKVQEIEGAISSLSDAEWRELRAWISERARNEAAAAVPTKVDWSTSACVTSKRDPATQISAQAVQDVLDELREEAGDRL